MLKGSLGFPDEEAAQTHAIEPQCRRDCITILQPGAHGIDALIMGVAVIVECRGFQTEMVPLPIRPGMSLQQVTQAVTNLPFAGTDCAQPMLDVVGFSTSTPSAIADFVAGRLGEGAGAESTEE